VLAFLRQRRGEWPVLAFLRQRRGEWPVLAFLRQRRGEWPEWPEWPLLALSPPRSEGESETGLRAAPPRS
jgi:hypothetical protein